MILLWGLLEDDTFRSVYDCLKRYNAEVAFVNHAAIARTRVEVRSHPEVSYALQSDENILRLEEMAAAYLRPYDHRLYEETASRKSPRNSVSNADLVHHLVMSWAEHTPAMVINRPSAEATNQSKLYQAIYIRESGFRVPESLVSNDRHQIGDFASRHGNVIYKSMSSVRSIVNKLDLAALHDLGAIGPMLFQQQVIGDNIRVHVVGDEAVACAVYSEGTDYRYAPARLEPCELPSEVVARCVALSRRLGLVLCGIDLIVSPEGEYYCLEANPSPAFSCFDISSKRSIAHLVAEKLIDARSAPALPQAIGSKQREGPPWRESGVVDGLNANPLQ